jgi:hypothetical protein
VPDSEPVRSPTALCAPPVTLETVLDADPARPLTVFRAPFAALANVPVTVVTVPDVVPDADPARFVTTVPALLAAPDTVLVTVLAGPVTVLAVLAVVATVLSAPATVPVRGVTDGEVLVAGADAVVAVALAGVDAVVAGVDAVVAACEGDGVSAEVTLSAALDTVPAAEVTAPTAELVVPDTVDTSEPPMPGEVWVAADAGAASRMPMPNARHRPPTAAPKEHKSTFRAGTHQPFMSGTLVTKNTNVYNGITI